MMASLPPAPPGLVIKEKNDKEIEAPSAPTLTNGHDTIEGFRIDFQGLSISDDGSKPTTLTLSKEGQVSEDNAPKTDEEAYEMAMSFANSMFRNGRFHYQEQENVPRENVPVKSTLAKTADSMKKNKGLVQPTSMEHKDPLDDNSSKDLQQKNNPQKSPPEKKARKK